MLSHHRKINLFILFYFLFFFTPNNEETPSPAFRPQRKRFILPEEFSYV